MQEFLGISDDIDGMLAILQSQLILDLATAYPECRERITGQPLAFAMKAVYAYSGRAFVILLDEWDCLFREYRQDLKAQKKYLDFLRSWLKDQDYVAFAYITGILPIRKYGTHSALNMFTEYSMTDPGNLSEYFGFTGNEVKGLCSKYGMSFEEARSWYDGYRFYVSDSHGLYNISIYSPKSVVEAMLRHGYGNYWNRTETYEALKLYIQMDMDGLKDTVVQMLGGGRIHINTETFTNDMTSLANRDDVLTLLVHLGYLTYDTDNKTVSIPNREVAQEYINAISTMDWTETMRSVSVSRKLLEALWSKDSDAVAMGIERPHEEISVLNYNDENSLSCTIMLVFYAAREFYTIIREMPAGKGFADVCLVPRHIHIDKPAVVIELKWNGSASGAIAQIKERNYPSAVREYAGNLLLAGINYDRKSKTHTCIIEKA